MKKILLVDSSPRKDGNSDVIVSLLAKQLKDAEVTTFKMCEHKCNSCLGHQHMGSAYVRRAIHTIKPCQTAKAAVFVYCRTQGFICLARAGLRNGLSNLPAVF